MVILKLLKTSPLAARIPQILFTLLISLANIFFIKQDRIPNQYYIQIKEILNHLNSCPPDPGLSLEGELFVGAHPRAPQSALGLSCRWGGGCPLMPPHPLPCRELQQGRGRGGGGGSCWRCVLGVGQVPYLRKRGFQQL